MTNDHTPARAHADAARIVDAARERASDILAEAKEEAREITERASRLAREYLDALTTLAGEDEHRGITPPRSRTGAAWPPGPAA
ncbi:MAG TPA: hypothetical protein VGB19_05285 [Actinomycetota bacterium]